MNQQVETHKENIESRLNELSASGKQIWGNYTEDEWLEGETQEIQGEAQESIGGIKGAWRNLVEKLSG